MRLRLVIVRLVRIEPTPHVPVTRSLRQDLFETLLVIATALPVHHEAADHPRSRDDFLTNAVIGRR